MGFFWRSPSKQGSDIRWSSYLRMLWNRYADDSLWGKVLNGVKSMSNRLVRLVNSHWIKYYCSSGNKAPLSQSRTWLMGSAARKAANWGTLQNGVKQQLLFQCSEAFVISISRQMNFWQIRTHLGSIYPVIARVWVLDRCCLSRDLASGQVPWMLVSERFMTFF